MKITLVVVAVLAVATVLGAALLVGGSGDGFSSVFGSGPTRTEVRCEAASTRTLVETVSAPGEIEPLTMVEISSEVSARIE